ncbi:MAG: hypothetical protein ABSB56_00865 [Nitrososphaerales archaeon]|jgi:hypothetical protein
MNGTPDDYSAAKARFVAEAVIRSIFSPEGFKLGTATTELPAWTQRRLARSLQASGLLIPSSRRGRRTWFSSSVLMGIVAQLIADNPLMLSQLCESASKVCPGPSTRQDFLREAMAKLTPVGQSGQGESQMGRALARLSQLEA